MRRLHGNLILPRSSRCAQRPRHLKLFIHKGVRPMRSSILTAAIAVAIGSASFTAAAAPSEQELAQLKTQIEALQAQLTALEERTDAQSDINLGTAESLDKLTTGSPQVATTGGMQ